MSFGKWLKEARRCRGLTQAALASACDVSDTYISRLENEHDRTKRGDPVRPALEIVDGLAGALGVSIEEARLVAGYAPAPPLVGFGVWLRDERLKRGMTQEELAELCGVTAAYISLLEHEVEGRERGAGYRASAGVIDKLARAIGVSYEEARAAAGYGPPEMIPLAAHEADLLKEFRALPLSVQLDVEAEVEALYRRHSKAKESFQ